jgi:hypothetical protein
MLVNLNPSNAAVNVAEDIRGAKTTTTVSVTNALTVGLAANAGRACYSLYNAGPATVCLREGSPVSATLYEVLIPSGFYYKEEFVSARYTGQVSLITASGTASVQVSEGVLS